MNWTSDQQPGSVLLILAPGYYDHSSKRGLASRGFLPFAIVRLQFPLLFAPPRHYGSHINICRAVLPLFVEVDIMAARHWVWGINDHSTWEGRCLAEYECLSPPEPCQDTE